MMVCEHSAALLSCVGSVNIWVSLCFGRATAALPAALGRQRGMDCKAELRVSFLTLTLHQPAGKGFIFPSAAGRCHVLHLYQQVMIHLACTTHTHTDMRTQTHTNAHTQPYWAHKFPALQETEPNSEIATLLAVVGPGSHVTTAGLRRTQQVAKDW